MSQIVLLGTGTCQLNPERNASSALVQIDDLNVLFDCGRGTAARVASYVRQDELRHIVISHFHPDHSSDLIAYIQAACWSRSDPRKAPLHIYGPAATNEYPIGIKELIGRYLAVFPEFDPLHVPGKFDLLVHEVTRDQIEIEGQTFEFPSLPPCNNHGLGVTFRGRRYALTADSHFHEAEVAFVTGANVAVIDYGHRTSDQSVVDLAVRAKPERLILSHVYGEPTEAQIGAIRNTAEAQGYRGSIELAFDGLTLPLL